MEVITSFQGRLLASGLSLQPGKMEHFTPLVETHVVFNRLVSCACEEMMQHYHKNGHEPDAASAELRGLIRTALRMPASSANHLLTRLLKTTGVDDSDRKQIANVQSKAEEDLQELPSKVLRPTLKALSRRLELDLEEFVQEPSPQNVLRLKAKLENSPAQREALNSALEAAQSQIEARGAHLNAAINDSKLAIKCLDRRAQGFKPWSELGVSLPDAAGKEVYCRLSDVSESWQRQILQAAVEAVKSHINLAYKVEEQRGLWLQAQKELFSRPEHEAYLKVRPFIMAAVAGSKDLRSADPAAIRALLLEHGAALDNWRRQETQALVGIAPVLREALERAEADTRAGKMQVDRSYLGYLKALYPEIGALFNYHAIVEEHFTREPSPPSWTPPDPYQHPKQVIWNAAQWRKIELPSEMKRAIKGGGAYAHVGVRLPTLGVGPRGIEESVQQYTARVDRRFANVTRRSTGLKDVFDYRDPATGKVQEVGLGAIRLVMKGAKRARNPEDHLRRCGKHLALTMKFDRAAEPDWVQVYRKKKELDPRTHEPMLPDKLIVVSFLVDLEGLVTRKAAIVQPEYGGRRRLKFIRQDPFKLDSVPLPGQIQTARMEAIRCGEEFRLRRVEAQAAWSKFVEERELKGDWHEAGKALRRAVRQMQQARSRKDRAWDYVTNCGDERAQQSAGRLYREIAGLRERFPGYEIAVVTDYRLDRKGDNTKWGKAFNRALRNSSGGQLSEKVLEVLRRMDPPVPVFEMPLYGLDHRYMNHDGSVNVIPFGHEVKAQSRPVLVLKKFSRQVAIVEQSGNDSGQAEMNCRVRTLPMQELRVDNLIDRFVRPSRYAKPLKPDQAEKIRRDLFDRVKVRLEDQSSAI